MSHAADLYQELILDHGRRPRNHRVLEGATAKAVGHNPLCGDQATVYVAVRDGVVTDVSFVGNGCAISQASTSLMTEAVKGKTLAEIEALYGRFHDLVMGTDIPADDDDSLGKLTAFSGVSEFPMRVKCATLAWHTLRAALAGDLRPATTE